MDDVLIKTIRCGIRTAGVVALLGVLFWGARYVGWSYEDTRVVLGIVNAYGPEFVALVLFVMNGVVFYRASAADNEHSFIHFFVEGKKENVYRLGYWIMLQVAVWSIFALFWREKLDAAYFLAVATVFVGKSAVDSIGHHFGKKDG